MAKRSRAPLWLAVTYVVLFGAATVMSPFLAVILVLPWSALFDGPSDYQSGLNMFYLGGFLNAGLIYVIASLVFRVKPASFKCGKCQAPIAPDSRDCPSCGFVFGGETDK